MKVHWKLLLFTMDRPVWLWIHFAYKSETCDFMYTSLMFTKCIHNMYILNYIIFHWTFTKRSVRSVRVWTHRASASRPIGMHCDAWKWSGDRSPSVTIDPMYSIWCLTLDADARCVHPLSLILHGTNSWPPANIWTPDLWFSLNHLAGQWYWLKIIELFSPANVAIILYSPDVERPDVKASLSSFSKN